MKIINFNTELKIDNSNDSAYLYLEKYNRNKKIKCTSSLIDENGGMINIDYGNNDEIIGIEFLPASKFFK